jgi:hypothetical protein
MNAYSYSYIINMNNSGLAVGVNRYGVESHRGGTIAFLTQIQANGSWGTPIYLWSGSPSQPSSYGSPPTVHISGISSNGQVLGYGVESALYDYPSSPSILFYYDIKYHSLINISKLFNSMTWGGAQLDDDGRVLVQAAKGITGDPHTLLLVPDGVSVDPPPVPEPATWAVFATLIVGAMAHKRIRSRRRTPLSDPSRLR